MTNDSDLDKVVVWLTEEDGITLQNSFEGVLVFGAVGSGKRSGLTITPENSLSDGIDPTQLGEENQ